MSAISPGTTVAIVLGAHEWPKYPQLEPSEAFKNAAQGIEQYLKGANGLALPSGNVKSYFDDPRSPSDILKDVIAFLKERQGRDEHVVTDVLVYYVGHAGLVDPDGAYALSILYTDAQMLGPSSLRLDHLAEYIRRQVRHSRRFFILDACFSGRASQYIFPAVVEHQARDKSAGSGPERGIAALCSSSGDQPSRLPTAEPLTMFSSALLQVLTRGDPNEGERLSIRQVGRLANELIARNFEAAAVGPVVHAASASCGELADMPFFPNNAKRMPAHGGGMSVRSAGSGHKVCVSSLPLVGSIVHGRSFEFSSLDDVWSDNAANCVQVVGAGGTGKTALVTRWFQDKVVGSAPILGWSFNTQDITAPEGPSSTTFFDEAFTFFGTPVPSSASVYTKAERLAREFRDQRVLLILDGVEQMLDPTGSLRDPALKALLHELATYNAGLVICTTQFQLADLPEDSPRSTVIPLDNLDATASVAYLKDLGVDGDERELADAAKSYAFNPLALTLLAGYLVDFHDGDIRARADIRELISDDRSAARHAIRIMENYVAILAGKPELDILYGLGYFNGPVESEALQHALCDKISDPTAYRRAIVRLRQTRLLSHRGGEQAVAIQDETIDCHPLIRQFFAKELGRTSAIDYQRVQKRLYEYFCRLAKPEPNDLKDMLPLFRAVYHGCEAGCHVEVLRDVYVKKICRGEDLYLTNSIGDFSTDLTLLANFFEAPWTHPAADLPPADRDYVISQAHFALRGLGRLREAASQMRALNVTGMSLRIWHPPVVRYSNYSQLLLLTGNVPAAIEAGEQALALSRRENVERVTRLVDLADAIHQAGDLSRADNLFKEAEDLQARLFPDNPRLFSVPAYRYCDLLLSRNANEEALHRATVALADIHDATIALETGLCHTILGRATANDPATRDLHLDLAVHHIRRAGSVVHFPSALLARGQRDDLDTVHKLCKRTGMRLRQADYHLSEGRLGLAAGNESVAEAHLCRAAELVHLTGYHRRDGEVDELRAALRSFGEQSAHVGSTKRLAERLASQNGPTGFGPTG